MVERGTALLGVGGRSSGRRVGSVIDFPVREWVVM
jgi:hypothetical protein